jgi:putative ABC transport system substrate-binding protein
MTRRFTRRAFARDLAALVGSLGLACLPVKGDAQQSASPRRIGVLAARSTEDKDVQMFRVGLREAGYIEGRDVVIEWRSANGDYARLPELAADLVQSKVEVIVVQSTPAAQAAKRATSTIPIVMATIADPVGSGLVASLAHPGGNVTGLSTMLTDLTAKQLQLLKEVIPRLTRVAVLWNPDQLWHAKAIEELKTAAPLLSIQLSFVGARTPEELGPAFLAVSRARAQALYVLDDPLFNTHRARIAKLASKARLPTMYGQRLYVDEGGLLSYGPSFGDLFRHSAGYVDKILKGAKPADLPIEQPTKFEFVVNLKTAKALGITIPESILLQADEVIK